MPTYRQILHRGDLPTGWRAYVMLHGAIKRMAAAKLSRSARWTCVCSLSKAHRTQRNQPAGNAGRFFHHAGQVSPVILRKWSTSPGFQYSTATTSTITFAAEAGWLQLKRHGYWSLVRHVSESPEPDGKACISCVGAWRDHRQPEICMNHELLNSIGIVTYLNLHRSPREGDIVGKICACDRARTSAKLPCWNAAC